VRDTGPVSNVRLRLRQ